MSNFTYINLFHKLFRFKMGPFKNKKSVAKSFDHTVSKGQIDPKLYLPLDENAFKARGRSSSPLRSEQAIANAKQSIAVEVPSESTLLCFVCGQYYGKTFK